MNFLDWVVKRVISLEPLTRLESSREVEEVLLRTISALITFLYVFYAKCYNKGHQIMGVIGFFARDYAESATPKNFRKWLALFLSFLAMARQFGPLAGEIGPHSRAVK